MVKYVAEKKVNRVVKCILGETMFRCEGCIQPFKYDHRAQHKLKCPWKSKCPYKECEGVEFKDGLEEHWLKECKRV